MDLETQARVTEDFVRGLLEHMGLEARVVSSIDEDRVLVEAQGLNLGLAIGQRGDTVRQLHSWPAQWSKGCPMETPRARWLSTWAAIANDDGPS